MAFSSRSRMTSKASGGTIESEGSTSTRRVRSIFWEGEKTLQKNSYTRQRFWRGPERSCFCYPVIRHMLFMKRSSEVWLLATGTAKADVVARAVQHDPVLPAGLVHGAEATYWFLDAAASRRLRYHRCGL